MNSSNSSETVDLDSSIGDKRSRQNEEEKGQNEVEKGQNEEEKVSESSSKVTKINDKRECNICMETEITLLPSHNCTRCKPDAWLVCEICDQNLLSRTCPYCNQDYKPWKFYSVPNQPKVPFEFSSIADPMLKYAETLKVRILCEILSRSNSAVYRRDQNTIYFSLPKDLSVKPVDMEVLLTSLPMSPERIAEDQTFLFANSTWDEIEKEIEGVKEEGEDEAVDAPLDPINNTIVNSQTALKWLMQKASSQDAVILTLLSPAELATMLAGVVAED